MRYQRLKRTLGGLFILAVSAGLLTGCDEAVSETADVPPITPVKLLNVADFMVSPADTFLAQIDATERAQLSFQVAGEVQSLTVKMGQHVKKGDVLATLDDADLSLQLEAAKANYALAAAQWERAQQLFAKKLVSEDRYDQAQTHYKAMKARYESAMTDVSYTRLVAPFDGVVAYTFVNQNQVVGAKQPILNLIDNAQLDVAFSMPVTYVDRRGIDAISSQTIWVTMDSDPATHIPASFKEISTQPNTDTNTFEAIVSIERPANRNLLSGMTAQVHVPKGETFAALRLPNEAWISKSGTEGKVWVMDGESNAVSQVSVTTDADGYITAGLQSDDLVVVAGVDALYEGQIVKAWQREEGI